jgi:8-oxo-dGTP diphosphatase
MKTFHVGIKGVIVKDNKVLVIRASGDGRDFWEVPGGRIDDNESIPEALTRELNEEVSNIHSITIHNVLDAFRVHKNIDGDISLVLIFYKVTADFDGDPVLSEEHSESQWLSKDEAIKLVHESCRPAIERAFEVE